MVETTIRHGGSLVVFANQECTREGTIIRGISALVVVSCFVSCIFVGARLVFPGNPPLGCDVLFYFVASRNLARPFQRWVPFGHPTERFFMSSNEFVGFGRPAVLLR